jgi:hypothetical protein
MPPFSENVKRNVLFSGKENCERPMFGLSIDPGSIEQAQISALRRSEPEASAI